MKEDDIKRYIDEAGNNRLSQNLSTKIVYYHGTAINELLAINSMKYIKKYYKDCKIVCLKGRRHCELALLHPNKMIEELNKR